MQNANHIELHELETRFHGLVSILAQTLLHMDNPVLYPVFLI